MSKTLFSRTSATSRAAVSVLAAVAIGTGARRFLLTVLVASAGLAPVVIAEERRTFVEELDPKKVVIFDDAAPAPDAFHKAISPDGKLRAEATYKKLSVYSVGGEQLLHEFDTSGSMFSPHFSADGKTVYAAVSRGNLASISTLYSWNLTTGKRTRWGECRGIVLEISSDSDGKRVAVTTSIGKLGMFALAEREDRWIGGEMVVFDAEHPTSSVLILCELPGIPSWKQFTKETKEKGWDADQLNAQLDQVLADAAHRYLPVRVGLTPDGNKIIGVTYTGNARVFDAETGQPELTLNGKGRGGPTPIIPGKQ